MATAVETATALAMAATEPAQRPTPEQIDEWARVYVGLLDQARVLKQVIAERETALTEMVKLWGIAPPHAEKSRRLNGRLAELTLTKSDTITILDDRVEELKEALYINGKQMFFPRLFAVRSKYEMVEGAEAALKSYPLSRRLSERVLNMFGRCFDIKPKKASLKVTIADPAQPAKPARKPRAKKEPAQQ